VCTTYGVTATLPSIRTMTGEKGLHPQVVRLLQRQAKQTNRQRVEGLYEPGGKLFIPPQPTNLLAAQHGVKFEHEAIEKFKESTESNVIQVGHVVHEHHLWLGCCHDGIIGDGRLLEIKCPFYREVVPGIPARCVKQLQIALEVRISKRRS
jgi:hypothetical protein